MTNILADPSIPIVPTGNPSIETFASLNVQGTTIQGDTAREFICAIGLTSNQGANATTNCDKVALYTGIVGQPGTGNIWSINPLITLEANSGRYNAQGIEIDLNNFGFDASGALSGASPLVSGLSLTGVSPYKATTAVFIDGVLPQQWEYGVCIRNAAAAGIFDVSSSAACLTAGGSHVYGLHLQGATYTTAAITLGNGPSHAISRLGGPSGATYDYVDIYGNHIVGLNALNVISGAHMIPLSNNAYLCGGPSNAWANIYSHNSVIVTSDPRLKDNIATIKHSMLDVINAVNPITFSWKVGDHDQVAGTERKLVHEHGTRLVERREHEIRDGKAYVVKQMIEEQYPLYDEFPVYDGNEPVYDRIAEVDVLRMHRVPRMVEHDVPCMVNVPRTGRRTHWGFSASDIKAAIDKHTGMDFGGYVSSDDGVEHLRPDQLIPVLWKALQELSLEVAKLKSST